MDPPDRGGVDPDLLIGRDEGQGEREVVRLHRSATVPPADMFVNGLLTGGGPTLPPRTPTTSEVECTDRQCERVITRRCQRMARDGGSAAGEACMGCRHPLPRLGPLAQASSAPSITPPMPSHSSTPIGIDQSDVCGASSGAPSPNTSPSAIRAAPDSLHSSPPHCRARPSRLTSVPQSRGQRHGSTGHRVTHPLVRPGHDRRVRLGSALLPPSPRTPSGPRSTNTVIQRTSTTAQ